MAFVAPQGNKTVMVDNSNNIVYPASFQKVVATQATIAGNNFTSVPSVIDPENATTTQLPTVESVVSYVADVVEGGSSGLIPAIQSDIQTLGQVKSNRGEFWFEGGALTTTNKMPLNTPFSCVFTCAMTLEEFDRHTGSYGIFGITTYWTDGSDLGWVIGRKVPSGNAYIGSINFQATGIVGGGRIGDIYSVRDYLDGNPHIWCLSYNGTALTLSIDQNIIASNSLTFEASQSASPFYVGYDTNTMAMNGKISRIKYFNFDMSDVNAPYTIADYIAGKDESPLLNLGVQSYNVSDMTISSTSQTSYPCETVSDSTTDTITITTTGEISAEYVWIDGRANAISIPQGANVEVSVGHLDVATSVQGYFYSGATRVQTLTGVSNANPTISFVAPANLTRLSLIVHTGVKPIPTGTILTITGLKIKVNGALLSLDDYSIKVGATQIIPDVSSNNNDATITGAVYGSKDNSIAKMAQLFYQSQQG